MFGSVLAEVATIALVIGVIVSCTTILVMVLGVSSSARADRAAAHRRPPPRSAVPLPATALATARARALEAARLEHPTAIPTAAVEVEPTPPEPAGQPALPAAPAGRIELPWDGRPGALPGTVDEVRAVIDHLVETNPRLLAEVITQWIRNDQPTGTRAEGPRPGSRLDRRR